MRVFRAKFKDKNGKNCKAEKWYIDFRDHLRIRHRIPGFKDKRSTETLGRNIETLVSVTIAGGRLDHDLEAWVNGLPDSLLKKFMEWGLVSGQSVQTMKPLSSHIEDYTKVLKSRNLSDDYTGRTESRLKAIVKECGFTYFKHITKSAVELYIGKLQEKKLSATSRGHYLDTLKTFLNWAVEDHRVQHNPLETLKKESRDSKRKGVLTPEQFITLVRHTILRGAPLIDVSGRERGIMYLLAGSTGLRRQELLSLEWRDLHLTDEQPFVLARPDTTKNGKEARLPLPASVASVMDEFKKERNVPDSDYVFSFGGQWVNTAAWIRADLKAAELPTVDREGNEIVFHSLRNSFISFLANSNTPMKVVQKLARHSDPKLTYNCYARTFADNEQEAVKTLPNFDHADTAICLATDRVAERTQANAGGQSEAKESEKTAFLMPKRIAPRGFEPLSPG